jgi:hypothetical protein
MKAPVVQVVQVVLRVVGLHRGWGPGRAGHRAPV